MAVKVSDYTAITGGVFDNDDLFDISEHTGSGVYQTRSITGAEIKASISGGSPLSTADQTVSTTGSRKITLGGSVSTDMLLVENAAGTDIVRFRGDDTIYVPTGQVAIQAGFATGVGLSVNTTNQYPAVQLYHSGYNGSACLVTIASTTGSASQGFVVNSSNAVAVAKTGFQANITGSSNGNIAFDLVNGDFKFGTGTGSKFGTTTTEKVAFWNTTPIVQPTALTAADATATNGTIATNDTITNNLRVRLDELEAKLSTAGGGSGLIA